MREHDIWCKEQKTSEISGKALSTLRNDRHLRRGIPYYKVGRSIRYRLADIFQYMERHRVTFDE